MYISNEYKTTAIFHIFNFSSDVYNKFHIGLSQQHYPDSSIFEDITHDDDQLSTKTTRDHGDEAIMEIEEDFEEKESLIEDITHDDDQLSTKTTRDHEDDAIMETEEDFEEKESLFEDFVCYILYLFVGVL